MDFEDLKQRFSETAGAVLNKSADAAKIVAEKASALGKKAKLSAEMSMEKDTLRKTYQALGQLFFEKYGDDPCEGLEQAVAEVKLSLEKIAAKQAEIDALKAEAEDACVEACACEETVEAVEEKADEAAEAVKEVAEDAVETVKEAAEDAAKAVKEAVEDAKE